MDSQLQSQAQAQAQRKTPHSGRIRVAVIGAGLAGLRAAASLTQHGHDVLLLEARGEAGGKLAHRSREGFSLDRCLQLISARDRRLLRWVDEAGLAASLLPLRSVEVSQIGAGRLVACRTQSLWQVSRTPGVRLRDAFRLLRLPRLMKRYAELLDPERPERAADLDWRSAADFARLYLGKSVFEHFATPLVTSVTLGNEHELSRVALLFELQAALGGEAVPGVARAGLGELITSASSKLHLRCGVRVNQIQPGPDGGFSLMCATSAGSETLELDSVVVATGASEGLRIAGRALVPAERDYLAGVRTGPLVTLAVALDAPVCSRPQLVRLPHTSGLPIEVVLAEPGGAGARCPANAGLVTLSATERFARASEAASEADVVGELLFALERVVPGVGRVTRFHELHRDPEGVPRFEVGAYNAMARFQRVQVDRRAQGRRLYWAGDYLQGPRLEDSVRSGHRAATALHADCV